MRGISTYRTARICLGIIEVCGWLLAGFGVFSVFAAPFILTEAFHFVPFAMRTAIPELREMPPILATIPGILMVVGGLLTVTFAQFCRAMVDMSLTLQRAAPKAEAPTAPAP